MADACSALDWSFLGSAASHSTFAGVASGFVFAVICVLVGRRDAEREHNAALVLFTSAFFVLALDSFLFASIAGEHICMRAYAEGMVASGLLANGAVSTFVGLAWVFKLFKGDDDDHEPEKISYLVVYSSEVIAILLLAVNAFAFLADLVATRSWSGTVPSVWALLLYLAGMLAILAGVVRRRPGNGMGWRALRVAAYSSVLYGFVGVLFFASIEALPRGYWEPRVQSWIVYSAVVVALPLPTVTLLALARTLPRKGQSATPQAHAEPIVLDPPSRRPTSQPADPL